MKTYILLFIFLISVGTSFSQTDSIFSAINKYDIDLLEEAIENGGDINAYDTAGFTPLCYTAALGYIDMTKLLIEKGAEIDKASTIDKSTPLMLAAKYGKLASCVYLVEHGADMKLVDNNKNPLILYAQYSNVASVIDYVKDTSIFNFPQALLYEGLYNFNSDFIDEALDMGVDVNIVFYNGYPPLSIGTYFGNYKIIKHLIDKGADVNKMSADTAATPLMIAVSKINYEVCDILLASGADPNIENKDGTSALDLALDIKNNGCANFYYLLRDPKNYTYSPDSTTWDCVMQAVQTSYDAQNTYLIYKYLKIAEYKIRKELSPDDTLYAYRFGTLWDDYFSLENYEETSRISDELLNATKKSYGQKSRKYLYTLGKLTTAIYFNTEKKEQTLNYANEIYNLLSRKVKEKDTLITQMLALTGLIYTYYKQPKKAEKALNKALQSAEISYGKNSELYFSICDNLHEVYLTEEKYKKASKLKEKCENNN